MFGLDTQLVTALAGVASVLLAFVLAAITAYYAWHAKRQADASRAQVETSRGQVEAANRQTIVAQSTLDLLLEEKREQKKIDCFTVQFQIEAAILMIDHWQHRLDKESFDLPEVIEMRPSNFANTIQNADRVDRIIAGYMGAALLYIQKAEIDAGVMRDKDPDLYHNSPLRSGLTEEARKRLQERAGYNLSVARFKLVSAQTRLSAVTGGHLALPFEEARRL